MPAFETLASEYQLAVNYMSRCRPAFIIYFLSVRLMHPLTA